MRLRLLVSISVFLFGFQLSAGTNPSRNWQTARVEQIQRVETAPRADHWEYVLISNGFVYTLRNGPRDAPYLNSSLGSEVKIASAASDANHPFDGDEMYAMDTKGQEHKMDLVSVVSTDVGCKK